MPKTLVSRLKSNLQPEMRDNIVTNQYGKLFAHVQTFNNGHGTAYCKKLKMNVSFSSTCLENSLQVGPITLFPQKKPIVNKKTILFGEIEMKNGKFFFANCIASSPLFFLFQHIQKGPQFLRANQDKLFLKTNYSFEKKGLLFLGEIVFHSFQTLMAPLFKFNKQKKRKEEEEEEKENEKEFVPANQLAAYCDFVHDFVLLSCFFFENASLYGKFIDIVKKTQHSMKSFCGEKILAKALPTECVFQYIECEQEYKFIQRGCVLTKKNRTFQKTSSFERVQRTSLEETFPVDHQFYRVHKMIPRAKKNEVLHKETTKREFKQRKLPRISEEEEAKELQELEEIEME